MAYTVEYFFNRFLDAIDQEGADIISVQQLIELLEIETYSYIEEIFPYIENNQQIRDSILPLSKQMYKDAIVNPLNSKEMIVSLEDDYLHLETVDVTIPNHTVREVTVKRRGEILRNKNNPNKKPTNEYPTVIEYGNTLAVLGSTETIGVKVRGFYISKPIFAEDTELDKAIVNLPETTLDKILMKMVVNYKDRIGDPNFQASYIQEQGFGKSNK